MAEEQVDVEYLSLHRYIRNMWTSNVTGAGDPDKKVSSGGACVQPNQLRVLPRRRKRS